MMPHKWQFFLEATEAKRSLLCLKQDPRAVHGTQQPSRLPARWFHHVGATC